MQIHMVSGLGRMALLGAFVSVVHLAPTPARGDDPKFAYGKAGDVAKLPPWAAQVTAGFGMTTGNAQSLNLSGAGMVSHRFTQVDLLAFDAAIAFQRSTVQTATDLNGDQQISPSEVQNITQTVSEAWTARLRYDHFFGLNSVYGLAFANGDVPAGRQFQGGVQAGYSRALFQTVTSEIVGEVGLDYSYLRFVVGDPNSISIVAIRAYLGYLGNPTPDLSWDTFTELVLVYKLL